MKIAVYTIALNEEKHVERWYNSVKDADYILIADTGSTDKTVEIAKSLGINVVNVLIKPFRFDTSRNAALAALPADIDYCISLDMDEVLSAEWRKDIEDLVPPKDGMSGIIRATLTWNTREDGTPGLQYGADRVHSRWGVTWRQPAHEIISTYGEYKEVRGGVGFQILHKADPTKSRSQYLGMLKMAVDEQPHSDRNAYYYARELFYYDKYEEATTEFKRHLSLPTAVWAPERASSMRHIGKMNLLEAIEWFTKAAQESPGRREPFVDMAKHYYNAQDWENCYKASMDALRITEKKLDYMCEEDSWNELPYDYAALSAYHLGRPEEAVELNNKAMEINPTDERLKTNSEWYRLAVSEKQS
jgi:glycosyltransferase involved in cell wall biosynthesis